MDQASGRQTPKSRGVVRLACGAGRWLPLAVVVVIGLFLWALFYPGLLSPDSITQYGQALTRKYTTIRPPVMSICLTAVLALGGNIQHLMLVQCLVGILGVYCFAGEAVRFFVGGKAADKTWSHYLALAITLVLLTPISPLPFYLMTFWTDVWILIAFCWMGFLWLRLLQDGEYRGRWTHLVRVGLFVLIATVAALVRHNSVILLPAVAGLAVYAAWRAVPVRWAACFLLTPVALYASAQWAIKAGCDVEEVPLENLVYGFDLAGLCVKYPRAEEALPFTKSCLPDDVRQKFYPGYVNLYGTVIKGDIWAHPDTLHEEYVKAWRTFPWQLARVKWEMFRHHFIHNPLQRFQADVNPNPYGLADGTWLTGLRQTLRLTLWQTFERRTVKWVFTRHTFWFILNILLCVSLPLRWWWTGGIRSSAWTFFLLIPLGYYLSYLLASLSAEFRYMYPSDVCLQVLAFSAVAGGVCRALARGWRWLRGTPAVAPAASLPPAQAA